MTAELPDHPESREESYLAAIAGEDVVLPEEPLSRKEQYLAYIAENGGGGGGGTNNFNQLTNRPKYNSTTMTGSTNIPKVPTKTSELSNDSNFVSSSDLPTVNDATLTITQNGVSAGTFTANDADNTTIALTDTTYNAFTGTDGTSAGAAGLVPAPATTDAGKFLKADGTWDSAGGSSISVIDNLNSTSTTDALSANQGKVLKDLVDSIAIRASGAPTTSTVGSVGTLYEDTTNGKLYQCTDTTGGTYTWEEVGAGGGSGPTVVQTTGTSTTDVMSQNAVTSMVYADPDYRTRIHLGSSSNSSANFSIAIGGDSSAGSISSVAIGGLAIAGSSGILAAVAVGANAQATGQGSIALGRYALANQQGQMDIGSTNTSYGYNNSNYRLLTGLYDGQSAHDAATVGQITPTSDSSAPTTATVGRLGQIQIDTSTTTAYMCVAVDDVTPAYTWKQITA